MQINIPQFAGTHFTWFSVTDTYTSLKIVKSPNQVISIEWWTIKVLTVFFSKK